jgi:molecular chaperone DnaK
MYSTEKLLREQGDKVDAADKQATEAALGELREALKTEDLDRIKKAQEATVQASHKLSEAMYRETQASTQPGAGAGGASDPGSAGGAPPPKGDVVDAEFEDLGEKK